MALNGLFCADVPLRNYSLTHLRCASGNSWLTFSSYYLSHPNSMVAGH